jgi:hypothetical protein
MKKQYIYIDSNEEKYLQHWDERHEKVNRIFKRGVLLLSGLLIVFAVYNTSTWPDSIKNPSNSPYVEEIAFNEGISPESVTQEMFNERYGKQNHFTIKPNK